MAFFGLFQGRISRVENILTLLSPLSEVLLTHNICRSFNVKKIFRQQFPLFEIEVFNFRGKTEKDWNGPFPSKALERIIAKKMYRDNLYSKILFQNHIFAARSSVYTECRAGTKACESNSFTLQHFSSPPSMMKRKDIVSSMC